MGVGRFGTRAGNGVSSGCTSDGAAGCDVPIVPRGGGTGAAAGAVPDGGVVLALDRLDRVRSFEPELWRIHVEAGVPTGRLKQVVRESGLMFAPDPGAPEQSQIGGNIATNAGGPHAFKYGVVGDWVTGIEAALPPTARPHWGKISTLDPAEVRSRYARWGDFAALAQSFDPERRFVNARLEALSL